MKRWLMMLVGAFAATACLFMQAVVPALAQGGPFTVRASVDNEQHARNTIRQTGAHFPEVAIDVIHQG